jgi:hypothetical protein
MYMSKRQLLNLCYSFFKLCLLYLRQTLGEEQVLHTLLFVVTKHVQTLCEQNAESFKANASGTPSYHCF